MLWVARHAPTTAVGRCYGRSEVAVEPAAAAAAERLHAQLRRLPPPAPQSLWSSPAARCRTVAEQLAPALGLELRLSPAVAELDFGAWEGRQWGEIEKSEPAHYKRWMEAWEEVAPPGGERPANLQARVERWAAALPPGAHLLVAHAGVVRALRVLANPGLGWPEAMGAPVEHLRWEGFTLAPATKVEAAGSAKPGSRRQHKERQ